MLFSILLYSLFNVTIVGVVHDASATDALIDMTSPRVVARGPQRVIVALIEFPDMKHTTSSALIRDIVFGQLDSYYREVSYGLLSITGDITDRWYQTHSPISNLNLQEWVFDSNSMKQFEREAVESVKEHVGLEDYDFLIIVAAGEVWPHAVCDFHVSVHDDHGLLRGIVVNEGASLGTYAHELGHVLPSNYQPRGGCGLPDLYSYDANKKAQDPNIFVGPWDIMGASNPPKHFSAWSKIEFGWITPAVIYPGATVSLPITMEPLEKESGTRAIVIPLTETKSYVIEVRSHIGYDSNLPDEGILVYMIDSIKSDGDGPVRVISRSPYPDDIYNAALKQGAFSAFPYSDVFVAVAYSHGLGYVAVSSGNSNGQSQKLPCSVTTDTISLFLAAGYAAEVQQVTQTSMRWVISACPPSKSTLDRRH